MLFSRRGAAPSEVTCESRRTEAMNTKYEVEIKAVLYARTQAEALKVVEDRLKGGYSHGTEDPAALLVKEGTIRVAKDQR